MSAAIVTRLHHSRRYDYDTRAVSYRGAVVDLVGELDAACRARGLTLSRWETGNKRCGWLRTITYAAHTGERRARYSELPDGAVVEHTTLDQTEGFTARCTAYKRLSAMLARVRRG